LHKALNSIIQGSAGDIMKRKTIEAYKARKRFGLTLRLTVHDELCGDLPDEEQSRRLNDLLNEQSFDTKVPIFWDMSTGANWAECADE
jgi:DNA polymerase I-like protein with 3'-5' exonuclease and polymerase domains